MKGISLIITQLNDCKIDFKYSLTIILNIQSIN